MAAPLVSDELRQIPDPLLPPRPRPKSGRPPIDDRAALTGILVVLNSGLPRERLPQLEIAASPPTRINTAGARPDTRE